MFMLLSDWARGRRNRFGYNFYKVEGFGVGFVVEWEGREGVEWELVC